MKAGHNSSLLRRRLAVPALSLCLVAALALAAAETPLISPDKIQKHVNFLASPQMKGRGSGTPENDRAAKYIADHFRSAGLQPGAGKEFMQKFTVTVGAVVGPNNSLQATAGGSTRTLAVEKDFLPIDFSDSGQAAADLVFAGYGITADEYRYDDYLHLDVAGKAVIVLRNEPQKDDEKSPFDGRQLTHHALIVNKAINARNHGAKAVIFVNDTPGPAEEDLLTRFGSLTENAGILLIQAKRSAVDEWLKPSGKTLAGLQKAIDEKLEPQSAYLPGTRADVRVDVRRIPGTTQNVVGILRGSDPKLAEEAIVIGAHYDHLGLGERNSLAPAMAGQVHAGADDNASGTAALLELASALASRRSDMRRTIVFVAFSGEELGLLGSSYYTKNPAWPLDRTTAMINLDMVGRPRENKIYVGGIGTSPGFKDLLERANKTGLQLSYQQSGYGSSDHSSFYVKNIPVLFFFSGLHADYHKPSDTPDRILAGEEARVADLALRTAMELAAATERPQFVRVQESRPVTGGGGGGYGAYFGSIPDMGEEVAGVKFADVRDASPAAKAGLKGGDILVEFAGKPIKNLYDFTYALRAHRPGETVAVVVLRGKERVTVNVTLEQRK